MQIDLLSLYFSTENFKSLLKRKKKEKRKESYKYGVALQLFSKQISGNKNLIVLLQITFVLLNFVLIAMSYCITVIIILRLILNQIKNWSNGMKC